MASAKTQKVEANPTTDEMTQFKSDHDRMKAYFAAQDKVTIKIPRDRGEQFVQVNGYSYAIAAGHEVKVPVQIAQMLRDADII
jgi:hypothetical protein